MTKLLLAAAASAALLGVAGSACAQGGYLPPPAYAYAPYDYAGAERGYAHHGFTLAGVRAGVTVLGVDLDAHAGLDIGLHDGGYGRRAYAPPPPPAPVAYAEPAYPPAPPPEYAPAPPPYGYAPPMDGPPMSYGYAQPCGCGW